MELRPWTLPNLLTFSRLVALPFLINCILEGRHVGALAIFLAAAITDIVDGTIARRFDMMSPLGAVLDPIADKLFLVSTFIVFALPGTPTQIHIPTWLLVLTIFRDLLIIIVAFALFITLNMRSFPPSALGKANTFFEISTLVAILVANIGLLPPIVAQVCFQLTAASTVASGVHYVWRLANTLPRGGGGSPGGR